MPRARGLAISDSDSSGEVIILRKALRLLSDAASPEAFEHLTRDAEAAGLGTVSGDLALVAGVAERIAYHKRREGELLGLYDTGRDITALRDTEELLRAIARRARQLVGSDIAYISSLEEEGNVFIVRATEGIVSEGFEAMRVPLGYGLCGQVAATRRPCYATNYLAEKTFNRTATFDKYVKAEGIVSMLGIPLEINTHVIGVLFVGDRFSRTYTPQEIAVLSSLAALATL